MPRAAKKKTSSKFLKTIFEPGIFLGIVTILITIIYGYWGVKLTEKNNSLNQQMLVLSKKQVELSINQILLSKTQNQTSLDLRHFSKLLDKTDTVINLSDSQLILNRQEQKIANENAKYTNISNESKFYLATRNLNLLVFQQPRPAYLSQWDSTERFTFLNNVDLILKSQLDNQYLLSNKYMLQEWLGARDSINNYTFNFNFFPKKISENFNYDKGGFAESQKRLLDEWRNCYIKILI